MILHDAIYGTFKVDDSVLTELMECAAMTRLRGVSQHGLPNCVDTDIPNLPHYTRYEHSVGVMLLLRKLGAGVEEQVAGLLHDASHLAFSHIIDWVFGDPTKGDYQDSTLKAYIEGTEISGILERNGFDVSKVSNLEYNKSYRLLERDAPNLCADRVDYALRDSKGFLNARSEFMAAALVAHDNEIMFSTKDAASEFGDCYMRCQAGLWASNEAKLRYYLISRALKIAISRNVITRKDLYQSEDKVVAQLRKSGDAEVLEWLEKGLSRLRFTVSGDGIKVREKLRYVDPKFLSDGKVVRLSDADEEYSRRIEQQKRMYNVEVRLSILD